MVPEVMADNASWATPIPQKTNGNGNGGLDEGVTSALTYARKVAPKITKRLADIALTSPNHNAARAAGRDVLQVAGLLHESTKIDVVLSFRAIFAKMSAGELDGFLANKVFPDRLRDEALKLLEHAP